MLGLCWAFLALLLLRLAFWAACAASAAPAHSSSDEALEAMLALASPRPGLTVYDLGCGTGRALRAAAARGARAVGIELDPFLVLAARLFSALAPGAGLVEVRWGSLWDARLGDADVVFCYLTPRRMAALGELLRARLRPGALVVSNRFELPGWPLLRADRARGVFAYRLES